MSFSVSDAAFQLTDGEETFEQSFYFTDLFLQYIFLIHTFCFGMLTLCIKPFGFHFVAWDYFEYHAHVRYNSFPWVFHGKLPRIDINVKVNGAPR